MNLDVRSLLLLMKLELVFSSKTCKCLRIKQRFCYKYMLLPCVRFEHCWAIPLESCTTLLASCQQFFEEGPTYFFSFMCTLWLNKCLDIDNMLFSMRSSVNGEATPINLHPNKVWLLDGWRQRWKSKCHCKGERAVTIPLNNLCMGENVSFAWEFCVI